MNAYHEERELTPLELARVTFFLSLNPQLFNAKSCQISSCAQLGRCQARNEALREEMEREPFIHIPAEEDYRAHQRTDEKYTLPCCPCSALKAKQTCLLGMNGPTTLSCGAMQAMVQGCNDP